MLQCMYAYVRVFKTAWTYVYPETFPASFYGSFLGHVFSVNLNDILFWVLLTFQQ